MILSDKKIQDFKDDLFEEGEWLDGKDGTGNDFKPDRDVKAVWELRKEEMIEYRKRLIKVASRLFRQKKDTPWNRKVTIMQHILRKYKQ